MNLSQHLVVPLCITALVVSVCSIRINQNEEAQRLSPDQVDQLWANALWETLLAFEDDAHEERMADFFTFAIEHAGNKAPIYVSYGVNDSGAWRIGQAFHESLPSVMIEGSTLSPLPNNAPWRVRLDRQIRKSLAKQTTRFLTGKSAEEHFEYLGNLMNSGTDLSVLCFQAAVAEDPNYIPGWYFLAMYSEGEQRRKALQEWARRDPENAFPLYLLATYALEQAVDAVEPESRGFVTLPLDDFFKLQLRLIEQGNKRSLHRQYEADWPKTAPQAKWLDAGDWVCTFEGLDESPVTILGLKNWSRLLAERLDALSPKFQRGIRLRLYLKKVADLAAQNGNEKMALRIMESMYLMGLKKHRNVPYDALQGVGGQALLYMSFQPIEADDGIVQLVKSDCKLSDIVAVLKEIPDLEELKIESRKPLLLPIMRGEVDLQQWEQDFANLYLRDPPEFFAELPSGD